MIHYILYIACVAGALAILMMMPRRSPALPIVGKILGAGTLVGLWLFLNGELPQLVALSDSGLTYYYIFSAIAIAAAAKVITHPKPVYSALWFVMVVLATAGLILLVGAEFMTWAMIIVYAGAIMVTYLFVIMLAVQTTPEIEPEAASDPAGSPQGPIADYDVNPREPFWACLAGFLLLAVLLSVLFEGRLQPGEAPTLVRNPAAVGQSDEELLNTVLNRRPAGRLIETLPEGEAGAAVARGMGHEDVENAERVGLELFRSHPLGLELAGVILLISLVGAVVIARARVPGSDTPGPA